MSKLKLFVENFLVFGLGGVIQKAIPLVMVPIVTRLMPNSDYFGLNDMSNTVSSFGCAFAVMGMYDAMYRMFFEKDDEDYKKKVCSTAVLFTIATSLIIFLLMIVFKDIIAFYFFSNPEYSYLVYITALATLVGGTNSIISAPTRMQNKRKVFIIANTVSSVFSYSISIPMLLAGYYVVALPLAGLLTALTIELTFGFLNHSWFSPGKFDFSLLKQMLKIAIPLFPNFLVYWLFNSCDKLMITNMIGIGATGIYAVGSKLGQASQLIYTAFAGGWQFFAFSTMKEKNQVESNSKIFEYLGIISFIATAFICAWSHGIYELLFTEEYVSGYIIAPYLFLAPLLLMLFQVEANQFLVIKNTWPNMFILSIGSLLNILINWLLIPVLGIEGAAVATLLGYIVSVVICTIVLIKMKLMVVSYNFTFAVAVMAVYLVLWGLLFCDKMIVGTISAMITSCVLILLYKKAIANLLQSIKRKNDNSNYQENLRE